MDTKKTVSKIVGENKKLAIFMIDNESLNMTITHIASKTIDYCYSFYSIKTFVEELNKSLENFKCRDFEKLYEDYLILCRLILSQKDTK